MPYSNITSRFLFLLLFSVSGIHYSQAQENSPYSRYALGNWKSGKNAHYRGMADVSTADRHSLIVNPDNPASYSALKLTSFQFGVEGVSSNIKNGTEANRVGSLSLAYLSLGLPVSKHIGVSFGILPFTRSKYAMQQNDSIDGISKVVYDYYGGGGTQKIYVGAAYRMGNLSIGLNSGYLFGNVINSSDETFTDTLKIISSSVTGRTVVGGVFLQPGIQYAQALNENYTLSFGASYTLAQDLHGKRDIYWKSFFGDVSDPTYQYNVDSVVSQKGTVYIPSILTAGMQISHGDQWKAGIEYRSSNWEKYSSYQTADSTGKSWMMSAGASFTPDPNAVNQQWKRMSFRAGVYTGKDIFSFRNTSLPNTAVTVGITYPIRRGGLNSSIGQLNLAIEAGQRGTLKNELIQESYTRMVLGLTFNDRWFIKRKYD